MDNDETLNNSTSADNIEKSVNDASEKTTEKPQKKYKYRSSPKAREMHCLRTIWKVANEFGFNLVGRVTLVDIETGKTFE